jgi:hypothetical protein
VCESAPKASVLIHKQAGSKLDSHFRFPIRGAIEQVNSYFVARLHRLIEQDL